jgi:hypothetical protein
MHPLYRALLADARFHELLLAFDRDLPVAARAAGCAHCGRGGALGAVPAQAAWRAGRARRGARPAVQLLLLGGSLPLSQDAAVVPLPRPQGLTRRRGAAGCGDAARGEGNPAVDGAFGVSRQTIGRWRTWWGSAFAASPFWKVAAAAFMPPADRGRLPARCSSALPAAPRRGSSRCCASFCRSAEARQCTLHDEHRRPAEQARRRPAERCPTVRLLAFGRVGVSQRRGSRVHEQWAHFRFSVIGQLLAAPPRKGMLRLELDKLAACTWLHPVSGEPVRFGVSTLEPLVLQGTLRAARSGRGAATQAAQGRRIAGRVGRRHASGRAGAIRRAQELERQAASRQYPGARGASRAHACDVLFHAAPLPRRARPRQAPAPHAGPKAPSAPKPACSIERCAATRPSMSTACGLCRVPDYAELWASAAVYSARRPGFCPHNQGDFSIAISASGTLKRPDRRFGGTTAESASSFSDGSTRR